MARLCLFFKIVNGIVAPPSPSISGLLIGYPDDAILRPFDKVGIEHGLCACTEI